MYTEFYGLKEKPFKLTPSPRFIYMSEGHKEAMALLTYGIRERKGFILLTGEVGTGKTTIIHTLIDRLDKSVEYVYIVNPLLTPEEFIDYLAFSAFKKRIHFKSKADFLMEFENFLKDCFQNQKIFILLIDEAHTLSLDLLEEIRLLSNLEFAEEKLINIFLIGQPELNETLNSPKGRATLQRISVRYDIPPLGLKETGDYLETRLTVAGASKEIFQKDAIEAIHRYSKGYPRTINILADNALLLGYSENKSTITSSMIEESYNAMQLEGFTLTEIKQTEPEKDAEEMPEIRSGRPLKWFLISFLILLIALIVIIAKTSWIPIPKFLTFMHDEKTHDTISAGPSTITDKAGSQDITTGSDILDGQTAANIDSQKKQDVTDNNAISGDQKKLETSSGLAEKNQSVTAIEMETIQLSKLKILPFKRNAGFSTPILAKKGDTLSRMAARVYGTSWDDDIALLKRYNPDIKNLNQIEVGQEISLPMYTILIQSYESSEKADKLYQQLKKDGYDVKLISPDANDKAKVFQVAVGAFKNKKEAHSFLSDNLKGRQYTIPKK